MNRLELAQTLKVEYRSLLEDDDHFQIELLSLLAHFQDETKSLLMTIYNNELEKMTEDELNAEYQSMLSYAETVRLNESE
jgi:hypothetical protein